MEWAVPVIADPNVPEGRWFLLSDPELFRRFVNGEVHGPAREVLRWIAALEAAHPPGCPMEALLCA